MEKILYSDGLTELIRRKDMLPDGNVGYVIKLETALRANRDTLESSLVGLGYTNHESQFDPSEVDTLRGVYITLHSQEDERTNIEFCRYSPVDNYSMETVVEDLCRSYRTLILSCGNQDEKRYCISKCIDIQEEARNNQFGKPKAPLGFGVKLPLRSITSGHED